MSEAPQTFRDIIDLWPTRVALARDIAHELADGRPLLPVRDWHVRDTIPDKYFHAVVAAAGRCGFEGVTYVQLTDIRKRKRAK